MYREGKTWFVHTGGSAYPSQAKVDSDEIAVLFELLALKKLQLVLPSEVRQADLIYGLDQPRFRIEVSAEVGEDKPTEKPQLA